MKQKNDNMKRPKPNPAQTLKNPKGQTKPQPRPHLAPLPKPNTRQFPGTQTLKFLKLKRIDAKIFKFLIFVFCLGLMAVSLRFAVFTFVPLDPGETKTIVFQVRHGERASDISHRLLVAEVIDDNLLFMRLGRVTRKWKDLKVGEYELSPAMSPLEILRTLTRGVSLAHRLTVTEGENFYQVAADLEQKGLADASEIQSLCKDPEFIRGFDRFGMDFPTTLEGYLFPDTYFFNRSQTAKEIVQQMVDHFFDHWGLEEEQAAATLKLTRHEVTTLASIIEKETGVARERAIISGVFHNRLRIGMRLQSDPTTIYGMWETYKGNIHRSDFLVKNNYNTYAIKGLPVGPISNPGVASIQAALHPVESSYLYFVSHNDGTHEFSETLAQHNQAVRKFQLDPSARIGKSWRDQIPAKKDTN